MERAESGDWRVENGVLGVEIGVECGEVMDWSVQNGECRRKVWWGVKSGERGD